MPTSLLALLGLPGIFGILPQTSGADPARPVEARERERAAAAPTWFRDASRELGASFLHLPGDPPFGMGGGVAWCDFDRDGDEDLLCTSGDGAHRLLRHDGDSFEDVSEGAGLRSVSSPDFGTMGLALGDVDGDGFSDVYVTHWGPNELFMNGGGLRFGAIPGASGAEGKILWSTSASFADFDRDGSLDLYVGNYIRAISFPYHEGAPNALFMNDGTGRFTDRAGELDVDGATVFGPLADPSLARLVDGELPPIGAPTAGCTLSVNTLDVDEDGDPELLVGNDFGDWVRPDQYYRNDLSRSGLVFTNLTVPTGFDGIPLYNMGINAADYDHDGDWDFYMSNLGPNVLLQNHGPSSAPVFVDVAAAAGPVEGFDDEGETYLTSWGTIWGDFDNDGWEDLYVVNGYIPAARFLDNDPLAENHLWRNLGDGTFERVDPALSGVADPGIGRGVGVSDVDGDGRLDFYVLNNGELAEVGLPDRSSRLFLNNGANEGRSPNGFLELTLTGVESNVDAIGARIEAHAGALRMKRQVLGDPVYVSSGSRRVHFGLGGEPLVERLAIDWPSGIRQGLLDVPANSRLALREPRVVHARQPEATVDGDELRLVAWIENRDERSLDFRVRFELVSASVDPSERRTAPIVAGSIAGSATRRLAAVVAVPDVAASPSSRGRGTVRIPEEFELRVTVEAAEASDARSASFVVR